VSSLAAEVLRPADGLALSQALAELALKGEQVSLCGLDSRSSLGALITAEHRTLCTAALDDVVHYEPGDLTITVGAGMPLASLADLLAAEGQLLPCQPHRRSGSVGGLIASAADGALALGYGMPRDVVIGAAIAYGDGSLARARGRVVKNVAGYDLPRLMVGSFGTLGAVTEVSFKLQPLPARTTTLLLGFARPADAFEAARLFSLQPWEPVFVDLLLGACTPQLAVGFDGRSERVDGLVQATSELLDGPSCQGRLILTDEQDVTLRTRLDDPIAHLGTAGDVVLRWWGTPARVRAVAESLLAPRADGLLVHLDVRPVLGQVFAGLSHQDEAELCAASRTLLAELRQSGSAVLLNAPQSLRRDPETVWGPPPADFELMTRYKRALDPDGTFVAGRFVGGL
jgi:glycolate oxidase FAD binding subunit